MKIKIRNKLINESVENMIYQLRRELTNGKLKAVMAYRIIYIIAVAIGPYMTISQVWTIADITNGLMAWPN